MELMKAVESDLEELLGLYQRAADSMEEGGLKQWHWGRYPSEQLIRNDVAQGLLYVLKMDDKIAGAVAILQAGGEPEYDTVSWTGGIHPGYFHRLVIDPPMQGAGLAGGILDDLQQLLRRSGCDCIRCDSSVNNSRALRLYEKMGFRSCGYFRWNDNPDEPYIALDKPLKRETPMWPIKMTPAFRFGSQTPWGGETLGEEYGKNVPGPCTGESLEVSCIPGLESTDGMGRKLPELIDRFGAKLVGKYADRPFPLLLKLISAKTALSVQVHPGDEYASLRENGKLGKNEAWLILETPEGGGELVYGMMPDTSLQELRRACEAGKAVEPLLRRIRVRRGDVCYIPSGCVHAIGPGITLYEIQESSDITYRFYDWDRTDKDGNKRELHLDKALDVTNLKLSPRPVRVERAFGTRRVLNEESFTLDIIQTDGAMKLPEIQSFGMITAVDGDVTLWWESGKLPLKKGETAFLPASAPEMTLKGIGIAALSMPNG